MKDKGKYGALAIELRHIEIGSYRTHQWLPILTMGVIFGFI